MALHDFSAYRLLTPGPVPLSPQVLQRLALPLIHHRTPEFEEIFIRCLDNLKWLFQSSEPTFILSSTGSGAMEAAFVNTLSPGDEVLVVVAGKFGERWAEMATVYGLKPTTLNVAWGQNLNLQEFENYIQKKKYKAIFSQVCETSTASLLPIENMAKILRKAGQGLFIVDAISALGCTELPMDAWGLDVVVAGSQKAFALPPGLSFIGFSKKAWEANKTARLPRFYFDLQRERDANQKGESYFSSSVTLIRALDQALLDFRKLGIDALLKACKKRSQATQAGLKALGLKIYSETPSPSLTAVEMPENIDSTKVRQHLEDRYKITVMGGQNQLKGKILRIGHMGAIHDDDVTASVEAIALSLKDFGFSLDSTQIEKAVEKAKECLK